MCRPKRESKEKYFESEVFKNDVCVNCINARHWRGCSFGCSILSAILSEDDEDGG